MKLAALDVTTWVAAGLVVAVSAGWARGQINYVSQTRSVSAATNGGSQAFVCSTFGLWSAGASSSYPLGNASASASQTTDLRSNAISFDVYAGAGNQNGFLAESRCVFDVTFTLTEASPFELVRIGNVGGWSFNVSLESGSTGIFSYSNSFPMPLSTTGVLAPGQYRMTLGASGQGLPTGPDVYGEGQGVLYIPAPGAIGIAATLALGAGRRRRA